MFLSIVTTVMLFCICSTFECLGPAWFTVNLVKWDFASATVKYLGYVVGQGQVWPVQAKVLAVEQFPSTTKTELTWFLGILRYYRRFRRNFSSVVARLTYLLEANGKYV